MLEYDGLLRARSRPTGDATRTGAERVTPQDAMHLTGAQAFKSNTHQVIVNAGFRSCTK